MSGNPYADSGDLVLDSVDAGAGELTSDVRFRLAGALSLDGKADSVSSLAHPADPAVLPHVIPTYR